MKEKQNWTDKLFNAVTMAGTAILMNLMFLVASLPIVTIGPAWCGLLSAIRYNIRGESWFQGFKKGYRTRFGRSIIIWCICLVLCLFFLNDLNIAVKTVQGITPDAQTVATDVVPETMATEPAESDDVQIEMGATVPNIVNCLISGVFFAMAGMITVSMLTLNVYIPTSISNWIKNGVNLFRYPAELFGAAALFWAPVLLFVFFPEIFFYAIMIFFAAYFALAAVCGTMVLKDPLIDFLVDARANGTLIAEEGSTPIYEEDEDE